MESISIRPYKPEDEKAIEEITFRTGFKGEDLTGMGYFDDQRLLYLIFIAYYPRFEPQHCFVAERLWDHQVIGFICGTPDTPTQKVKFFRHMVSRIAFRAFGFTLWRYPRTFINLMRMSQMRPAIQPDTMRNIVDTYPAHLHINLLAGMHRQGIGTRLIHQFEQHLSVLGVPGVHLQTSNHNRKAVPFYHKQGYSLISNVAMNHFMLPGLRLLTFGKIL